MLNTKSNMKKKITVNEKDNQDKVSFIIEGCEIK
jgi:hypothetical protein